MVEALAKAVQHYGNNNTCVLIVIQDHEKNVFDQRGLEYQLWNKHRIPCLRLTLDEIATEPNCGNHKLLPVLRVFHPPPPGGRGPVQDRDGGKDVARMPPSPPPLVPRLWSGAAVGVPRRRDPVDEATSCSGGEQTP